MRNTRDCSECENQLKYNDERYEVRKITFKPIGGNSQTIKLHLCPTCFEILLGDV